MVAPAVRRLAVLLVALGLAGASCGGDPPAPPSFTPPTVASSPTPTGPVEPVLPEAARRPTEEGAKTFAVFYWDMATYAQATGDTKGFRQLSAITCGPCNAGADGVERVYRRGGRIQGGGYTAQVLEEHRVASDVVAYSVTLRLKIQSQVVDYPGSDRDREAEGRVAKSRLRLNFLDGAWTVAYLEAL